MPSRLPGLIDGTRTRPLTAGQVTTQVTAAAGPTGSFPPLPQPVGSRVRFSKVGGQAVFREYAGGKPVKPTLRLGNQGKGRDYYRVGDFFAEGEFEPTELKKMFPDAGISAKEFDFWDVVRSLAGLYERTKLPLVRRLDAIQFDPSTPWTGSVNTSYYLVIDDQLVPLNGRNTQQLLTAKPGAGSLNDHFAWAPTLKSMSTLQDIILAEAGIVQELAQDALLGAAVKGAKGWKVMQKLAKSKKGLMVAKTVKKLSKLVDQKKLVRAATAFATEFTKSLATQLAKYSLKQLAGKEDKLAVADNVALSNVSLEPDDMVIKPGQASSNDGFKAYVGISKTPKIDVTQAVIIGSAAFARSLLIDDNLAAPISQEIKKKVSNKEMAGKVASFVKDFISGLGNDFTTGAIANAAQKTLEEGKGASQYPENLINELKQRFISRITADFVKGALHAAAFGFDDD